jgi:hypothetical protein
MRGRPAPWRRGLDGQREAARIEREIDNLEARIEFLVRLIERSPDSELVTEIICLRDRVWRIDGQQASGK